MKAQAFIKSCLHFVTAAQVKVTVASLFVGIPRIGFIVDDVLEILEGFFEIPKVIGGHPFLIIRRSRDLGD